MSRGATRMLEHFEPFSAIYAMTPNSMPADSVAQSEAFATLMLMVLGSNPDRTGYDSRDCERNHKRLGDCSANLRPLKCAD